MPGNDLASIIDAAVSEKLERVEAKRFGKTKKPRKSLEEADTSPGVRGISAQSGVSSANVTGTNARSKALTANVAPSVTDWSSTTTNPTD